jgi:hypothetical protein
VAQDVSPFFLQAYLNSKYGRHQIWRHSRQTEQVNLNCREVERILVPVFAQADQEEVAGLVQQAIKIRSEAKSLYAEAEALLLAELGLDDLNLSHQPTYTRSSSQAWAAGRLDAEYFQPKYVGALRVLTESRYEVLGRVAELKKGIQARSKGGDIPYASIKDIENFVVETEEFTSSNQVVFADPGTIVLAITGATIGKVATNATTGRIAISGDLVAIRPHKLSPHYLLIVLASPMIQELCEQSTTGATNGHLAISAVAQFPIPILPEAKMDSISQGTAGNSCPRYICTPAGGSQAAGGGDGVVPIIAARTVAEVLTR